MADATIFQITTGFLGLKIVDTAAVGYLATWKAPGGKTVVTVAAADYDTASPVWSCQVLSGMLTASANENQTDVPATFCGPAKVIPQPAETSFSLDAEFLQDINVSTGLNRYLFEHDTKEAYFWLSFGSAATTDPPMAIGRVRIIAGAFGGPARSNLTATISLPLTMRPSIEFGIPGTSVVPLMAEPEGDEEPEPASASKGKAKVSAGSG